MTPNHTPWLRNAFPPFLAVLIAVLAAQPTLAEQSSAGDAALFERLDADSDGVVSVSEVSADHKRLFDRLVRRGDANRDGGLTSGEFLAALVPSRPEKPIEEKQPATFPQANAVRYLLLSLDTDANRMIEAEEVPEALQPVFLAMIERLDRDENGRLEPGELSRGGGPLAQIAGRYVAREGIDVAAELRKLEKSQGKAAARFEEQRPPVELLGDPQQARAIFSRLDGNGDGELEPSEAPEPFQPQLERLMRLADRDRNGRLSEREFLTAAERISRIMSRRERGPAPGGDAMPERESTRAERP